MSTTPGTPADETGKLAAVLHADGPYPVSRDGRQSWELDQQMLIRRRKDVAAR